MSDRKKTFDISLNIDELRKQKKHFVEGKKATYLDLKVIEMDNKQYNDFVVVVKVSKDDYEKGVKGDIVGYGKDWNSRNNAKQASMDAQSTPGTVDPIDGDDLPF